MVFEALTFIEMKNINSYQFYTTSGQDRKGKRSWTHTYTYMHAFIHIYIHIHGQIERLIER